MIHSSRLLSRTDLRAVCVNRSLIYVCRNFTRATCVHFINAARLVKEVIAVFFASENNEGVKREMTVLLLEILCKTPSIAPELPMPQDERLFCAINELLLCHRREAPLSDMASMSERTFSRRFLHDTGFSFRT